MESKNHISQKELDRLLDYFKFSKLWKYYIIIYNLCIQQKKYVELQRQSIKKILIPDGIPVPEENPFKLKIRTVNKQLKIYQGFCGIKGVSLSTKIFSRRFSLGGEIYYGNTERDLKTYKKNEGESYLYVIKHSHRDKKISELLTDKKVGISFNFQKRFQALTLGTIGVEVVRVWTMNSDLTSFMEKKLHELLKERKLVGEWFSDDDGKLVETIDGIMSSLSPSKVEL